MKFDLARCLRPLLSDELLLRADPRIAHNATLLATIADEAPEQLKPWAQAIIDSYRLVLEIDQLVVSSLLVAALFDRTSPRSPRQIVPNDDHHRGSPCRRKSRTLRIRNRSARGRGQALAAPAEEDERAVLLERLLAWVDDVNATMLKRMLDDDS